MATRFRKSINIMPGVKLNLNKKSVGLTLGGKGAHYTINSKGRKTATVGIPGTGISYTSTSSGGKKKESSEGVSIIKEINFDTLTPDQYKAAAKRGKKKLLLVTIFLGLFGGHYFLMHRYGMALLYLFTGGLFGIGWIVDIVRIACTSTNKPD